MDHIGKKARVESAYLVQDKMKELGKGKELPAILTGDVYKRQRGIRANAIAPGFILTDMTAALSDEVRAEWAKKIPLRRGGTPEDLSLIHI